MKVYIAGPINSSGLFVENLRRALEAATMVREAGHFPFVPNLYLLWQLHCQTPMPEETMMEIDREWLLACDVMIRLPGQSKGADIEERWCQEANIPVYKHPDERIGDWKTPVRLFLAATRAGRHPYRDRTPMVPPTWKRDASEEGWAPSPQAVLKEAVYPSLSYFQGDVAEWLTRQPFGDQEAWEPLVGMMEELGELSHAHLKSHQKIRGDAAKHHEAKRDAVGDIFVYMAGYCLRNGLDLGDCVRRAWEEVRTRDWNKNQHNGNIEQAIKALGSDE